MTYEYTLTNDFAKDSLRVFRSICKIPRCSLHAQDMFSYLCSALKDKGYEIKTDKAKNIYAKKGRPKICLQSHYDMVCVGDSQRHLGVEVLQKDGFLYARNSSLGADNGIGIACMLAQNAKDIELLFTNDEEVGMLGANDLTLGIESNLILNLDSEDIHEIVLGCAGGMDIECSIHLESFLQPIASLLPTYPYIYQIKSRGFLGGHSGIEIHKNKENAISEYGFLLQTINAYIVTLNAGEKRNSIPIGVNSIILSDKPLAASYSTPNGAFFDIIAIQSLENYQYAYNKNMIIPLICAIHSGVYATSPQGTLCSLNLSILHQKQQYLDLIMMARANSDSFLNRMVTRLQTILPFLNPHCNLKINGYYAPWEKSISSNHKTLKLLCQIYEKHHITPHLTQIHAGLECGILKKQILKHSSLSHLDVISIGPTIVAPHSCEEALHIEHFEVFCAILSDFINSYKDS